MGSGETFFCVCYLQSRSRALGFVKFLGFKYARNCVLFSGKYQKMAEVLAVIGLVSPAISGCISACEFWMRAEGTGKEFSIFKIRLDLQAARLKTWKLEWGLDKSEELLRSHALFKSYAPLAVRYLYLIHFLLRDLQTTDLDFDFHSNRTANKRMMHVLDFDATEEWVQAVRATFDSVNQRVGVVGRIRWAMNTPKAARKSLLPIEDKGITMIPLYLGEQQP